MDQLVTSLLYTDVTREERRRDNAAKVAQAVVRGRRVLVIVARQVYVRAAQEAVLASLGSQVPAGVTLRRANGEESIAHHSGGLVEFRSTRSAGLGAVRGIAYDEILIDDALRDELLLSELVPCVVGARGLD